MFKSNLSKIFILSVIAIVIIIVYKKTKSTDSKIIPSINPVDPVSPSYVQGDIENKSSATGKLSNTRTFGMVRGQDEPCICNNQYIGSMPSKKCGRVCKKAIYVTVKK